MKTTSKFQSSIDPGLLQKLKNERIILENFKKSGKCEKLIAGGAPALRVPRAETWLTVDRSLP